MRAAGKTDREWRVRVGVPEDVDAVLEVERAVSEAPHWRREDYLGIFRDVPGAGAGGGVRRCLFVAEDRSGLLGFAVGAVFGSADRGSNLEGSWASAEGRFEGRLGEIESVAVEMSARRLGVGGALCRGLLRWCEAQGAEAVELEVRAESLSATALYRGLGFREIGIRPRYYRDPVDDALLMRLLLPNGRP